VLGRMGAAGRALQLIIGRLADVPAAIAFVQSQADDEELWQHLIQLALQDPESTGAPPRSTGCT
jgi:vacuolar protein sorting-associated protein 41